MSFWDWDDDYDFSNGASFGDFDLDNDGSLDVLEKSLKINHYSSLWDDEDKVSNYYNDNLDYLLDEDEDDDDDGDDGA